VEAAAEGAVVLRGEVVLIVESEAAAGERMRSVLGRAGCQSTIAVSMKAARRLLGQHTYACIILSHRVRGTDTVALLPVVSALQPPTSTLLLIGEGLASTAVDLWARAGAHLLPRSGTTTAIFLGKVAECVAMTKSWRAALAMSDCLPTDPRRELLAAPGHAAPRIQTRDGGTIGIAELQQRARALVRGKEALSDRLLEYFALWAQGLSRPAIGARCRPRVTAHTVKKGLQVLRNKLDVESLAELEERLGIVVRRRKK
jgi:CheY-like chemotaxis protein